MSSVPQTTRVGASSCRWDSPDGCRSDVMFALFSASYKTEAAKFISVTPSVSFEVFVAGRNRASYGLFLRFRARVYLCAGVIE